MASFPVDEEELNATIFQPHKRSAFKRKKNDNNANSTTSTPKETTASFQYLDVEDNDFVREYKQKLNKDENRDEEDELSTMSSYDVNELVNRLDEEALVIADMKKVALNMVNSPEDVMHMGNNRNDKRISDDEEQEYENINKLVQHFSISPSDSESELISDFEEIGRISGKQRRINNTSRNNIIEDLNDSSSLMIEGDNTDDIDEEILMSQHQQQRRSKQESGETLKMVVHSNKTSDDQADIISGIVTEENNVAVSVHSNFLPSTTNSPLNHHHHQLVVKTPTTIIPHLDNRKVISESQQKNHSHKEAKPKKNSNIQVQKKTFQNNNKIIQIQSSPNNQVVIHKTKNMNNTTTTLDDNLIEQYHLMTDNNSESNKKTQQNNSNNSIIRKNDKHFLKDFQNHNVYLRDYHYQYRSTTPSQQHPHNTNRSSSSSPRKSSIATTIPIANLTTTNHNFKEQPKRSNSATQNYSSNRSVSSNKSRKSQKSQRSNNSWKQRQKRRHGKNQRQKQERSGGYHNHRGVSRPASQHSNSRMSHKSYYSNQHNNSVTDDYYSNHSALYDGCSSSRGRGSSKQHRYTREEHTDRERGDILFSSDSEYVRDETNKKQLYQQRQDSASYTVSSDLSSATNTSDYYGHSSSRGRSRHRHNNESNDNLNADEQDMPVLTILLSGIQLIILVLMTCLCGIAPIHINPTLGPYPNTLSEWGAENAYKVIYNQELWRFFSPSLLHTGLLHFIVNVSVQLELGSQLERKRSSTVWFLVYILSSVGSALSSYIMEPNGVYVGSSGALMGLLGALLSDYITSNCCSLHDNNSSSSDNYYQNYGDYNYPEPTLGSLLCSILIVFLLCSLPNINIYGCIGGFATGLLLSLALSLSSSTKLLQSDYYGCFKCFIAIFLTVIFIAGLSLVFYFSADYMFTQIVPNEYLDDLCTYYSNVYVDDYICQCQDMWG